MRRALRLAGITLATTVILVIVLVALVVSVARLALPMTSEYREEIAEQLSKSLQRPLTFGTLEAGWEGINPYLQIGDLRVFNKVGDKQGTRALLQFDSLRMSIDIPHYLLTRRLEGGTLAVSGTTLELIRSKDGSVTLQGFEDDDTSGSGFRDWLLGHDLLSVQNSEVYWTDVAAGTQRQHFTNVNLKLRNAGQRHLIDGTLAPGTAPGQPLILALDIDGDLARPAQWNARFYAQASNAALEDWLDSAQLADLRLDAGRADFQLWGDWSNAQLQAVQGRVALRELRLDDSGVAISDSVTVRAGPTASARASGELHWQRRGQGWSLAVADLVVGQGTTLTPPGELRVIASGQETQSLELIARLNSLSLENASALLLASGALDPGLAETLKALQPRGELRDVYIKIPDMNARTNNDGMQIRLALVGVSTQAWKQFPALNNLDATLRADETGGRLILASRLLKLGFSTIFRSPIAVDRLTGQLSWRRRDAGWLVHLRDIALSNLDLGAAVNGSVLVPHDGSSPIVNLGMGFERINVASIDSYLPINLLSTRVRGWFEKAFLSGFIGSGSALLHGRVSDFPFRAQQGNFLAQFGAEKVLLDYARNWPYVKNLQGSLAVRNHRLDMTMTGGVIADAELVEARASIADMISPGAKFMLQGSLRGTSTTFLQFLKEGPLADRFEKYVKRLSTTGQGLLALDLLIPLKDTKSTEVQGSLALTDSTLLFDGKSQDVELTGINGTLDFTREGFTGKDVEATLLGQKMRLDPRTVSTKAGKSLLIDARGKLTGDGVAELVERASPSLAKSQKRLLAALDGALEWSGLFDLHSNTKGEVVVDLTLESGLQGLAVKLPAPLRKSAKEKVALRVKTTLGGDEKNKQYRVSYGKRFNAVFELGTANGNLELTRGDLELDGDDKASLPDQGLKISGKLPGFSWDAWNDVLGSGQKTAAAKGTSSGLMQKLNDVDVHIGVLEALKRDFHDVHIKASKRAKQWSVDVNSEEVAGTLAPPQEDEEPWTMDFERLHIAKSTPDGDKASLRSKPDSTFDPHRLPAMQITSKSFKYGELDLGRLKLDTVKRSFGLHVNRLELGIPTMAITGEGDWEFEGGRQVSRFELMVTSEDLGKTLTVLGYDTSIADGQTQIDLKAHWEGAPMDFALERLNGVLGITIGKGRFLDIDPGAGRILGLLSIEALPRRLSLDFTDIFAPGFAFDSITSRFTLRDGDAYTDKLLLEAPSANISVTGRVGLAARDYDQVATVKPELGATLPLAAALVGGPVAGAAVFLAQKLLKPAINEITEFQYTITGPWKDPEIARVGDEKSSSDLP